MNQLFEVLFKKKKKKKKNFFQHLYNFRTIKKIIKKREKKALELK